MRSHAFARKARPGTLQDRTRERELCCHLFASPSALVALWRLWSSTHCDAHPDFMPRVFELLMSAESRSELREGLLTKPTKLPERQFTHYSLDQSLKMSD